MPAAHERKPMNFIERWLVKIALAKAAARGIDGHALLGVAQVLRDEFAAVNSTASTGAAAHCEGQR